MNQIKRYKIFSGQPKILIISIALLLLCSLAFQALPSSIYENMLDLKFGFNYQDIITLFEVLSSEERNVYIISSLTLDIIFPALYVTFFLGLYSVLEINNNKLIIVPVLTGISDILENIQIALLMYSKPDQITNIQLIFGSSFNQIKWILVFLSLVILIFAIFKKGLKRF
ncbi:MAG: hypothetical protein P8J93_03255 [SAR86 cluster bacterium]|nr:hypothetical protein [SAR86 cluster bacterium]